ncbi:alpha/beta hydrolase [Subtercola boreus]|uniref:Alpha/beta hydrolase n=1 Tax=Subtercola boreus TaxID=120213 RepID=A0A3E0VEN6_9MICO|nr:alpha/beta hydrolase [Subtercola boreus]RFA08129.1 alpha/beta hydrolase [Subtercola boreus]TQL54984.1 pimeloyl-ACP methyl ester carboxylesterase [Subtercola boreus]
MSTFALIHDAWHAGEVWDRMVPGLIAAGHTCHAPSLTGHGALKHLLGPDVGLQRHVTDIAGLLESENLVDVILVGHGYSGLVIEGVADRMPERVAQLVYLDAMIPADGEAAVDIDQPTRVRVEQAAATGESWRIAPDEPTSDGWFGVTEPEDIRWLQSFIGDESARCFTEPVRIRNPQTFHIPRAHIDCVRGPSPEAARRQLPTLQPNGEPAVVRQLDAGHDSMVTDPDALVDLLLRFTRRRS